MIYTNQELEELFDQLGGEEIDLQHRSFALWWFKKGASLCKTRERLSYSESAEAIRRAGDELCKDPEAVKRFVAKIMKGIYDD